MHVYQGEESTAKMAGFDYKNMTGRRAIESCLAFGRHFLTDCIKVTSHNIYTFDSCACRYRRDVSHQTGGC